jgi:rhodanese-related sulfurtransferase
VSPLQPPLRKDGVRARGRRPSLAARIEETRIMAKYAIALEALLRRFGTPAMPLLFDVRRSEAYAAAADVIPTARWRDHRRAAEWAREIPPGRAAVVYCVYGHQVSESAAALLRAAGVEAFYLDGGIEGWRAAGAPLVAKAALERYRPSGASHWVTREAPRIDRLACPWFVRRFVDPDARFHYVSPKQVSAVAQEIGAIAYDIAEPGVEFSHDGPRCSFDAFLRIFGVRDPALDRVADIIRGADTGRPEATPQGGGLLAITLGLGAVEGDDHALLERAMPLYDGLYGWARFAASETHGWPPKPGT